MLLREREEEAKRMRLENCLNYVADMLWAMASGKRFKDGTIEPYTQLIKKIQQKATKPQENEDFFAILKNRVENRKKGGDPA